MYFDVVCYRQCNNNAEVGAIVGGKKTDERDTAYGDEKEVQRVLSVMEWRVMFGVGRRYLK